MAELIILTVNPWLIKEIFPERGCKIYLAPD